jgi:hemerythrin superfamily protein
VRSGGPRPPLARDLQSRRVMDATQLLTEQHTEVDNLFAKIEKAEGITKRRLFEQLADKLAAHAEIEEKIFYPGVMAKQTEELLLESVEEHLAMKRIIADLLTLDPDDGHFAAKITVLKEQVRHHAHDEEEKELFVKVRKLMSKDELEGMGGEMAARFNTLIDKAPRRNVPAQTKTAAPLPAPM